jgi:hypothetical protein
VTAGRYARDPEFLILYFLEGAPGDAPIRREWAAVLIGEETKGRPQRSANFLAMTREPHTQSPRQGGRRGWGPLAGRLSAAASGVRGRAGCAVHVYGPAAERLSAGLAHVWRGSLLSAGGAVMRVGSVYEHKAPEPPVFTRVMIGVGVHPDTAIK